MLKQKETILFITSAAGIVLLTCLQLDETFYLYQLGQLLLGFLFACTFLYSLFKLIRNQQPVSFARKAAPLMLAFCLAGLLYIFFYLVDTDGGKKEIMTGGYNHDLNSISFRLFEDHTFKLLSSAPFGGTYYRGTYTLQNDTLRFNNDSLKRFYPSLTFILKEDAKGKQYFDPTDSAKAPFRLYVYDDVKRGR